MVRLPDVVVFSKAILVRLTSLFSPNRSLSLLNQSPSPSMAQLQILTLQNGLPILIFYQQDKLFRPTSFLQNGAVAPFLFKGVAAHFLFVFSAANCGPSPEKPNFQSPIHMLKFFSQWCGCTSSFPRCSCTSTSRFFHCPSCPLYSTLSFLPFLLFFFLFLFFSGNAS